MSGDYKFSFQMNDECVSCGACESVCPTNAISQGADKYQIDPTICTRCGACVNLCPVSAIKKCDAPAVAGTSETPKPTAPTAPTSK